MKLLRPREIATSIFEIDFARLYDAGKRAVLFDLDNTLGKRRSKRLEPQVLALLDDLKAAGFRVGILTNRRLSGGDQVIDLLAQKYPLLHRARKPGKNGFLQLIEQLDVSPQAAVMVGDRLLTDIFGANRLGIYSIRICKV
ncbi:MAG TPA: HAD-IIIA family hydrolase [Candidatus Heimdallarchaeota archaeon]|nr:HAD-IIIA family hydrolase [Candidatus Heimdallarchaeota archaeon]